MRGIIRAAVMAKFLEFIVEMKDDQRKNAAITQTALRRVVTTGRKSPKNTVFTVQNMRSIATSTFPSV